MHFGQAFRQHLLRSPHVALIAVTLAAAGYAAVPSAAHAQFICQQFGGTDGGSSAGIGGGNVVCGIQSQANGSSTTVVGSVSGQSSNGDGNSFYGAAVGRQVTGNRNTAIGYLSGNSVTGSNNAAVGVDAGTGVVGDNNSAFGLRSGQYVTGSNNVAMGNAAGSGAFGNNLVVSNTVAIGNSAVARADGAVAIGNGAVATRENQFALGTAANTYTTAGITSAASKAAQTGPTQLVTSDAGGNLATTSAASLGLATTTDLGAVNTQLSSVNTQLSALGSRMDVMNAQIDSNRTEARQGIAAAMALTSPSMPSAAGRTSWAVNAAYFRGETATGASLAHRLNTDFPLAITGGYTYGGGSAHGGRVGLQGEF